VTEPAKSELRFTFPKSERLHSKKLIEELFNKGSYFYLYPFRVTYFFQKESAEPNQLMVSVSKRKFKSAVSRNRIKRLMKEAYRLNKHLLAPQGCLVAIVYTSDEIPEFPFIQKRIQKAMRKLNELSE